MTLFEWDLGAFNFFEEFNLSKLWVKRCNSLICLCLGTKKMTMTNDLFKSMLKFFFFWKVALVS